MKHQHPRPPGRPLSLQQFLTRLIWLCVLLLLLLAVWLAVDHVQRDHAERRLQAHNLARNLAADIDTDLSMRINALHMLAGSPLADDVAHRPAFFREAQGFLRSFGSHVALIDTNNRLLWHTRRSLEAVMPTLPLATGQNAVLTVLKTGQPAVGDVFEGRMANEKMIAVAVPVLREGKTTAVLLTLVPVRDLQSRLTPLTLPKGWSLALRDSTGEMMAHAGAQAPLTAGPLDTVVRVLVQPARAPWSIVLAIPRVVDLASLFEAAAALGVALLGATVAGVLGGRWAGRRLSRSVASLARRSDLTPPAWDIVEIAAVRNLLEASVTEREHANTAKRESESLFRGIFEQAAQGIVLVDAEGRFLMANQQMSVITGYPIATLLTLQAQEITHPDDVAAEQPLVRQLVDGVVDTFTLEKRYIRADGRVVWINVSCARIRHPDGRPEDFIAVIEDIQRRKDAEAALLASEATLFEAQRLARLGHWRLDLRTGQRTWSAEAYRVFGCDPALPPPTYPAIKRYYTPEGWEQLAASVQAGQAGTAPFRCDIEIVRADGVHRWITVRGETLRDASGVACEIHGTLQDVTDRVEDREKLRISDLALKSVSQGVLITDPDGRILFANAAFSAITGYSPKDTLAQTGFFFHGPLTDPDTLQVLRQAMESGSGFSGELLSYRRDGSTFWNDLSVAPVRARSGQLTQRIVILRDVTERKAAQDARLHQQRHLAELVQSRTAALNLALQEATQTGEHLRAEISEHQRTEARLEWAKLMLNHAARLARLGAWSVELWDLEHLGRNLMTWSQEMYRLFGYAPGQLPQPLMDHAVARMHPDDRLRQRQAVLGALARQKPWEVEYRLVHPDGTERLVLEIGEITFDTEGKPVSMDGAVKDITEQRAIERRLRDSEARLRIALAAANAASFECNFETGQDDWSDEFWGMLDLETNAAPASLATWLTAVHPDDQAQVSGAIATALAQGEPFEIEWRVQRAPDAPPRWLLSRASPVFGPDGRVCQYQGLAIDISRRKAAELALAQSRNDLEHRVAERTAELSAAEAEQRRLNRSLRLLSDSNFAIARATSEGQLMDELCRLVVDSGGYLSGRVGRAVLDARKSVTWLAYSGYAGAGPADDLISWDADEVKGQGPTGTALRTGATQIRHNVQVAPTVKLWQDISIRRGYTSVIALPLIARDEVLGVLTLFSAEASVFGKEEVKLLEELADNMAFGLEALRVRGELETYKQQLEQRVAERTAEIAALNGELREKAREADAASQAKSLFLATVSHEIRTPLNAVVGLTDLLADSPLDRRQRNYTEKIEHSAQALRALIDDILDLSRIESGALRMEQAPLSLRAILRNAASVVGVSLRDKPIEVLFDVARDVPDALVGDALRLQQILLNLTSNAVKFTEAGEIAVTVRCLVRDATQATLQIAVRDTGIGIAPEQQGAIFEMFTQAETSTSRLYGGSGLGLSICNRIASLMGGRIEVESTPGVGSEFRLVLPVTLDPGASPQAPENELPGLRVLVIDDHDGARHLLQQTCDTLDWQTSACGTGEAGLAALQAASVGGQDYDLLLLDWRMPGMDGIAMLRQAMATPGLGLPLVVLMVSIFDLEQAVAVSDDLDLDGIVIKPITPESLLEAVTRAHSGDLISALPSSGKTDLRLSGLRLLVAEDNHINQEILMQMLTRAGAEVVVVSNGREALEAVRTAGGRFDAVLMDIQMPVMDGYEATDLIRNVLGQRDLPIIAVTALARAEDHEKSRRAGMAGHLDKPLKIDALLDILTRVTDPAAGGRAATPANARHSARAAACRYPGLDVEAALQRFGGDGTRLASLLRQFLDSHAGDVEAARSLLAAHAPQDARRVLHDLCGMAGFLQAAETARAASAAEQALLEERLHALPPLLQELQAALDTLAASIAGFEAAWAATDRLPSPPDTA